MLLAQWPHLFISLIYSPAFSFTWKRRRVSLFSRKSVFTLTLEALGPVSFFFRRVTQQNFWVSIGICRIFRFCFCFPVWPGCVLVCFVWTFHRADALRACFLSLVWKGGVCIFGNDLMLVLASKGSLTQLLPRKVGFASWPHSLDQPTHLQLVLQNAVRVVVGKAVCQ